MFASLILPDFRLQAALRWRECRGSAALAEETKNILCEVNATARTRGISPNMTPAQAMARDPEIQIFQPNQAQEKCLNARLIEVARSLAPEVEHSRPGAVLADVRRAARGLCWQQLGEQLVETLQKENLVLQVAVAPTPDLALLAAEEAPPVAVIYNGSTFTAGLSITSLKPSEALLGILREWGISTVGDFLKLPREDLVERLGPEVHELIRKVSSRHRRPLRLVQSPPVYAETFDFDYEIESTEPLLFLLRRFLNSLCARLQSVFHVADQLTLRLPLENSTVHERVFAMPAPTANVDVLYRVLETYLETLQLPHRPVAVALNLRATAPSQSQLGLFEAALRNPNRFGETLARLKALLGNDHVGIPETEDTHRPDCFRLRETFEETYHEDTDVARGLPLRRYRPPIQAQVEWRHGQPIRLMSFSVSGIIRQASGPFRISGQWWDSHGWATEEWDVDLAENGLYRISRQHQEWHIEGCYEVRGTSCPKRF